MARTLKVIYEKGLLKPLSPLELKESEQVQIIILDQNDDLPSAALAALALAGKNFEFLADPGEDVYSLNEGEPV